MSLKEDWEWRLELEGNPVFTKLRNTLDAQREALEAARLGLHRLIGYATRLEVVAGYDLGTSGHVLDAQEVLAKIDSILGQAGKEAKDV